MESKTTKEATIDANDLHYRNLNTQVRSLVNAGTQKVVVNNVHGQRYLGIGLNKPADIELHGMPGNDLGVFMDGPTITVFGDVGDGTGYTMSGGKIVVHGCAGDSTGLFAQGGEIFIRDDAGFHTGTNMKASGNKNPALIVGGTAQDFTGEYMTGGIIVLLGISKERKNKSNSIGRGMHGGVIFYRGPIDESQLSEDVSFAEVETEDKKVLTQLVTEFSHYFDCDAEKLLKDKFTKLNPKCVKSEIKVFSV